MGHDLILVLGWWVVIATIGLAAFPLASRIFSNWFDKGYALSKALGFGLVTYIVYALGTLHIFPFTTESIILSGLLIFTAGVVLVGKTVSVHSLRINQRLMVTIVAEEIFFLVSLILWSWVKGHEASIRSLEKFMDYGFTKSVLNSNFLPAPDMWYAGQSINYYYFGHIVMAVLTKLSGIDLAITFNLMLATLFALTSTMSFAIACQLLRQRADIALELRLGGSLLTSFILTLGGNLQTIYAFTQGYTGDPAGGVKPFWELWWPLGQFFQKLPEGLSRYWYANATRFIPFTIHEFPSYSFVVSDVHGHVLSLPFALFSLALLVTFFSGMTKRSWRNLVLYGFFVGLLLMTNALDGPIYAGLFVICLTATHWKNWKLIIRETIVIALAAGITALPFLRHFSSFAAGIAINCPPAMLAQTKWGPFLFETVNKCQKSPVWMLLLLWGFFIYCGLYLLLTRLLKKNGGFHKKLSHFEWVLVLMFLYSLALIIFPEFFYFKDIYPAHFRSNTMFKLGYQAFIMFSIVSGYAITTTLASREDHRYIKWIRRAFFLGLTPLLFLVVIFPVFSVRSYFRELSVYEGLDGIRWLSRDYPDNYNAIAWLNSRTTLSGYTIVEADGDSYTEFNQFSAFTGIPTIVGWSVHEWLWRGGFDLVAPRKEQVKIIYESTDIGLTKTLLDQYNVRYVIVGKYERVKYPTLAEWKFNSLGRVAYRSGETVIYAISAF